MFSRTVTLIEPLKKIVSDLAVPGTNCAHTGAQCFLLTLPSTATSAPWKHFKALEGVERAHPCISDINSYF
jgi:hypothetical protein